MSGAWLLTGGLGGLGLRGAALLARCGASRLVLSSRSGRVARDGQGLAAQLESLGGRSLVVACDSASAHDTLSLLGRVLPISGVLHAAGVGDKGLLVELEASRAQWMMQAKAASSWLLSSVVATSALSWRVLFSSVGSGLGNVGQANYAAGNSCLDAQALSPASFGAPDGGVLRAMVAA